MITTKTGKSDEELGLLETVCGCSNSTAEATSEVSANSLLPSEETSIDPSFGDPAYVCSFTYFFENCIFPITWAERQPGPTGMTEWVDGTTIMKGEGTIDEPDVGPLPLTQLEFGEDMQAWNMSANQLMPNHELVDFVGRTENLTAHFEEALVAAGALSSAARFSSPSTVYTSRHAVALSPDCRPLSIFTLPLAWQATPEMLQPLAPQASLVSTRAPRGTKTTSSTSPHKRFATEGTRSSRRTPRHFSTSSPRDNGLGTGRG